MTWQRIDENTYIDDTLVTCAEYQLFIDEMREQGKYYQPDHWTSYRFLDGQAREHIVGARHADVEAFCEWLTQRGDDGWMYRLPTQKEAAKSLFKPTEQVPIGYWIHDKKKFYWINILADSALKNYHIHKDIISGKEISEAVVLKRPLDFSQLLSLDLTFDQATAAILPMFVERDVDYVQSLLKKLEGKPSANDFAAVYLSSDLDRIGFINLLIRSILEQARTHNEYLDLAIAFIIIRERIAGRSPAFEGIRLVKERIK